MIKDGWYQGARKVISPNFNERPQRQDANAISLLIIHNISLPPGEFGGEYVELFFQNKLPLDKHPYFASIGHLNVSSHCYIRRTGEVVQFVPFQLRAWHAGRSKFEGLADCNDYSIGIELEGTDTAPYTEQQYAALTTLSECLLRSYPQITLDRIAGHSDVAPERKTDPGPAFDWSHYKTQLGEALQQ